jgi:hypothetical protein
VPARRSNRASPGPGRAPRKSQPARSRRPAQPGPRCDRGVPEPERPFPRAKQPTGVGSRNEASPPARPRAAAASSLLPRAPAATRARVCVRMLE